MLLISVYLSMTLSYGPQETDIVRRLCSRLLYYKKEAGWINYRSLLSAPINISCIVSGLSVSERHFGAANRIPLSQIHIIVALNSFVELKTGHFITEKSDRWYILGPAVGFEPTASGLRNRCSTTELRWHI
jgi:hypothetical protein